MDIRAAELTADHLGRTVKIDLGNQTVLMGHLVSVRHKLVRDGTRTRLDLEAFGDQRVRVGFNAIGVVELF
jgi:hypothetical protein